MKLRFASENEILNWDKLILNNPDGGNDLQTKEFAQIKLLNGWKPRFIVGENLYILAIEKTVPFLGKIWYTPKGPGVLDLKSLKDINKDLKIFARANGVFLVRMEPEIIKSEGSADNTIAKLGLRLHRGIQSPNTVVVDITKDIDEIIASFSPKTRYNIRAAKKADVETELVPIDEKSCLEFYEMMKLTVHGKAFLRNFDYYKNYWTLHAQAGLGFFMYAKYQNEVLAMDFITILGNKAVRKDAASPRERTVRGSSALLEVAVIEYLKSIGITTYDLCGCPPSSQIKNHDHPFYGVGVFKTGFNDNVTDYIGCLDLVVNKNAYKFWDKIGEKLLLKLYFYSKHDLYY